MKTFVLIMAALGILFGLMSTWFFVRPVSGNQEMLRELDSLNSILAEPIVCPVVPAVAVETVATPDYSVLPQTADSDSLLALAGAMLDDTYQGGSHTVAAVAPAEPAPIDDVAPPPTLSEAERKRLRRYEAERRKEVLDILNGTDTDQ